MNKLTAIALMGTTSAQPGPAVATTWPIFGTAAAPGASDLVTGYVKDVYSNQSSALTNTVGLTRAVRSDVFAVYTQSISAPGAAVGTVVAQGSGETTRSFWVLKSADLGTYAVKLTNKTTASVATGAQWTVCTTIVDSYVCNSLVQYITTGTAQAPVVARLIYKNGAANAAAYDSAGGSGNGVLLTMNMDILMASQYHSEDVAAGTTTDGSKWCTEWDSKVAKDGTVLTIKALYGLVGRTKCTWFLTAEDNTVGPTFQVSKAESFDFDMQWFEFASSGALDSNALIPSTSVSTYFLGAYAAAGTNGAVHLNPLSATPQTGWLAHSVLPWKQYKDPTLYAGGSIGTVEYFPGIEGDAKESQKLDMDYQQIMGMYAITNNSNNQFNSAVSTYNPLREAYDSATTSENERIADALKAAFEPMITIPERPCAPMQPAAYSGVFLDLAKANQASDNTQPTTFTAAGAMGWLKRFLKTGNASNNKSDVKASIATGFVYLTADTSASTAAASTKAGHVFGRLGQSQQTMTDGYKPFVWAELATATEKAAMMVSIFPTTDASAGLASGKTFEVSVKGRAWAALSDFNKPSQPGAATNPMSSGSAVLSLGVASAVVLATLA